ncbi:MarR family winged helix-turn-helix transcriptional regulator [Ectobacillus panaciterrae]|uniref:MarR family winged helix-turn-helix transcriptional regulator n=1 Tax=Ectobacillus panaciterrae TaxID=363872 RepID=UPI000411881D|nr:MarR family transcriptional regulator [Ectobacillus panaciterrae]
MIHSKIRDIVARYVEVNSSLNRSFSHLLRLVTGDALTPEQFVTMCHIQKSGACTSSQLADEFGVKRSAITSIVNRLFEKELVRRTIDPKDRRTTYLTLTEQGDSVCTEMNEKLYTFIQPVIHEFEDEEINTFLKNLERLSVLIGGITKDQEKVRE